MIRLSEIKLTLAQAEQPQAPLRAAAAGILGLDESALGEVQVFKRSFDARKAELLAVYIVDVALADPALEAQLLARLAGDPHIAATPGHAMAPPVQLRRADFRSAGGGRLRPLRHLRRAGAGPDGLPADRAGARQDGARAHQGHLGPVAQACAQPGEQCAVRRGRRRHLLRRQAVQPDQGPAPPGPQGHERVRPGRRARGNPGRRASAHRHLQAGEGGGEHARADHRPGRRDPLPAARDGRADRGQAATASSCAA